LYGCALVTVPAGRDSPEELFTTPLQKKYVRIIYDKPWWESDGNGGRAYKHIFSRNFYGHCCGIFPFKLQFLCSVIISCVLSPFGCNELV